MRYHLKIILIDIVYIYMNIHASLFSQRGFLFWHVWLQPKSYKEAEHYGKSRVEKTYRRRNF